MDPRTSHGPQDRLRAALHARAALIDPPDRLEEVLEAAAARSRGRRWLPLAAVAAVAAVVAGVWVAELPRAPREPVVPATSPTGPASATTSPTATASPAPSPTATPTSADGRLAALPVYLLAQNDPGRRLYRLQREWLTAPEVTREADAGTRAAAAVRLALAGGAPTADGYVRSWGEVRLVSVRLTPSLITLTLSGPGPAGFAADTERVSVQQLVWTVQAAAGARTPVRFALADGSAELFPGLSTERTYDRPASDLAYEDLASLWVTSPTRGQVLPAGPVTVRGEACVFEATAQWQLLRDGQVVDDGTVTASAGAPARGTWEVALGVLEPGSYVLRVFEPSMAGDGTLTAETTQPFTVG